MYLHRRIVLLTDRFVDLFLVRAQGVATVWVVAALFRIQSP